MSEPLNYHLNVTYTDYGYIDAVSFHSGGVENVQMTAKANETLRRVQFWDDVLSYFGLSGRDPYELRQDQVRLLKRIFIPE